MKRRAFTLIELLVVIAIIGLLSTIAVVSLTGTRAKARDTKRLADLKQIQSAVEFYMIDNNVYPSSLGVASAYIPNIPTDPINTAGQYGYYYVTQFKKTGSCSYLATGLDTDYLMGTRLENPNGVSGSCPEGVSAYGNPNINYLLGN